ncbi:MAG TPA: FAD-binding oxidoreductase [Gaiellales bacterium]|jgi:glycine/D-amino acid oxidase-like deaminating enzyme|nr:FAD-binding oxidoreductase [Gaiellales bacterium]
MSEHADVVVIGGGLFGTSIAYQLCRRGTGRVLLLERGALGSGDSGRTFGMVRRHYSNAVTALLAMRGSHMIMHWGEEVGVGDSGYVETGYLLPVPESLAGAARDNVARLASLGLGTSFVGPEEIARIEPLLALDGIAGAAYEPDGGFADAHAMILAWFAAGYACGLEARLGCEVSSLLVERGRVRGVRTPDGDVGCDRVVLATGAWARELLLPAGVDLPIALKRIQVAVLRQPAGAPRPNVVCSDAVTNVVVRPDRGALFCAVTYFADEPLAAADDCDHDASPGYEEVIRRALAERYPALAQAAWQRAWAGPYDYSPDWNPMLGEAPGVEGLYLALAWSGHGFKLSPAVGEVVAAEVVGDEPVIDVTALRPTRFAEGKLLRLAYGQGARA